MRLANPIEVLLNPVKRENPVPAAGTAGLQRVGDPPAHDAGVAHGEPLVFITANTLLEAEETARSLNLAPTQWRAVTSVEDVSWHEVPPGSRIVSAGVTSCTCGVTQRLKDCCGD